MSVSELGARGEGEARFVSANETSRWLVSSGERRSASDGRMGATSAAAPENLPPDLPRAMIGRRN